MKAARISDAGQLTDIEGSATVRPGVEPSCDLGHSLPVVGEIIDSRMRHTWTINAGKVLPQKVTLNVELR
jgi:hypothetical protein